MAETHILVINCGSSSLKFSLMEPLSGSTAIEGLAECLDSSDAALHLKFPDGSTRDNKLTGGTHAAALKVILGHLPSVPIGGVGHRVVHGGETFSESALVDEAVLRAIKQCAELAPLHNPANLLGIQAAREHFPGVPHVAVFDTAFHQTLPSQAFLYAIPHALYEHHKVRRYGFHGTSHRYVSAEAAKRLGRNIEDLQLLTAHLGNGCSACAIRHGRSMDTTMGLTPLEGLVMGTRSGDVDPNLHEFLVTQRMLPNLASVTAMLNRESGLLGLSGLSGDMRALTQAAGEGNERATLAIEVFCYRLAKALLGLGAALDRIDALVFTGGIGENSALVRERTAACLRLLRAEVDPELNSSHGASTSGRISTASSGLAMLVVPTNEELVIARETARFLKAPAAAS